ncbi:MAG: hypothetical protein GY953_17505, partial [bacterium]|nr:hypothetical protein [bacterium]
LRKLALTTETLSNESLQVSPDGKHIAYLAGVPQRLWIHDLDSQLPREIEGSEGARYPFWAPGSDVVAFAQGTDLKKVSVRGGPATTISGLPGGSAFFFTGDWNPDGSTIVVSSGNPRRLYEIPAGGGEATPLTEPGDSNLSFPPAFPQFLPEDSGKRALLFFAGEVVEGQIVVQDLETGEREVLTEGGPFTYSPSGHILFQPSRDDSSVLFAMPFSTKSLRPTGEAFPIAENAAFPSVAADGTLVYLGVDSPRAEQLIWRDRSGAKVGAVGDPHQEVRAPAISPDGGRVLVRAREGTNWDIWVHDTSGGLK